MQECAECPDCYCTSFESCYGFLNLEVAVLPTTPYYVFIKDKFDNYYTIPLTSDSDGNFSVPLADFPEGLFNEHAGKFTLTISTKRNESTNESMTIGYDVYTCIVFDMFSKMEA